MIQRRVSGKTGTEIDFKQPRFEVRVNEDVKPKYLKAVGAMHPVLFHGLHYMMFPREYGLQYDIVYARP